MYVSSQNFSVIEVVDPMEQRFEKNFTPERSGKIFFSFDYQ